MFFCFFCEFGAKKTLGGLFTGIAGAAREKNLLGAFGTVRIGRSRGARITFGGVLRKMFLSKKEYFLIFSAGVFFSTVFSEG